MNIESNQTPPTNHRHDGDLDWMAFQYVSGELNATEVEAFEERLASDQDAREAVAGAVQLAETTAFALESAVLSTASAGRGDRSLAGSSRAWTSMGWTLCGIAAALAIAVTLSGVLKSPAPSHGHTAQVETNHGEVRELAMAWASGRTDLISDVTYSSEDALPVSGVDVDEAANIETPSWMLIAVAGLAQNGAVSSNQNEQGLE
jgi:anti-sigma-K factor RskA